MQNSDGIKTKIISGIEPFQKFFFNSCFFSSFFSVAEYYGTSICPMLSNGIGAYMFYNTQKRCSAFIQFRLVEELPTVAEKMGLRVKRREKSSSIIQELINSVQADNPAIVALDYFYESVREDVFHKEHLTHYLLVYGYDLEKKIFYITEQKNEEEIRYEKMMIPMSDVEQGYQSFLEQFYKEGKDSYWIFSYDRSYQEREKETEKKVYLSNIKKQLERIRWGQSELQGFYQCFLKVSTNQKEFFMYANDIIRGSNDIIKFITAKRYLYERIFSEDSEERKMLEEIRAEWILVRGIVGKAVFAEKISEKKLEKLRGILEKIIQLDDEFIEKLLEDREMLL